MEYLKMNHKLAKYFLPVIMLCVFITAARSQDGGSVLVRADKGELLIYGEVVGTTAPLPICDLSGRCQAVVLRVLEVIKGNYQERFIKVWFNFAGFEKYAETFENYIGLNRSYFDKGKKWIFILNDPDSIKNSLFNTAELRDYDDTTLLRGYMGNIIPANDYEEVTLMKQFLECRDSRQTAKRSK
jgi:hypothetical protein